MADFRDISYAPVGGTLPVKKGGGGESASSGKEVAVDEERVLFFPDKFEFYKKHFVYFAAKYLAGGGWTDTLMDCVAGRWFKEFRQMNEGKAQPIDAQYYISCCDETLSFVEESLKTDAGVYASRLGFEVVSQQSNLKRMLKSPGVVNEILNILRPVKNARMYYRLIPEVVEKLNKIKYNPKMHEKEVRGIEFIRAVVADLGLRKSPKSIRDQIARFDKQGLTPQTA